MTALDAAALRSPETIARRSHSSFLVAFRFLPRARRESLTAIYAFCRVVDDAADEPELTADARRRRLAFWLAELDAAERGEAHTPVGRGLQRAIAAHGVDPAHLRAIADGVAMDLAGTGYDDLAALLGYCDKVASAVGLACLPVLGTDDADARAYAVELGRALQLTNVARDLFEDADGGRCYVPRAWLRELAVEPGWLAGDADAALYAAGGAVDRLVAKLTAEAAARFALADAALARCSGRAALLAPEVMAAVYRELLAHIATAGGGYVRRRRRVRVGRWRKLWLALGARRRLLRSGTR